MAKGILEIGQGEVSQAPVGDTNIVRLADLRQAISTVYQTGVDLSAYVSGNQAQNNKAVFIDNDGIMKVATNLYTGGAERSIGVYSRDRVFLNGTVIVGFSSGSLERGREYWIQGDGTLATAGPPTGQDRWAVRLGVALNSSDLLVSYHSTGVV